MGRGTAILRFGSALHSRRFPGPSTQRLFRWLEAQLEMRGVDPAVYSRYLISLLQLDDAEFERSETSDHEFDGGGGGGGSGGSGGDAVKRAGGKKSKRKRQQQQQQQQPAAATASDDCDAEADAAIGLASGVSSRKRAAAVRCLQSACNDPYEVDELIDELCYRLKRLNGCSGTKQQQQQQQQQQLPQLPEEEAYVENATDDVTDSGRAGSPEELLATAASDSGADVEEEAGGVPPQAAEDYVCAFPALSQVLGQHVVQLRQQQQQQQQQQQLADRLSAWARGPPRGLTPLRRRRRRLRHQQQRKQQQQPLDDEGYPEDGGAAESDDDDDDEDEDDQDEDDADADALSVASEGSEILQLVSHILHSFNRELEDENGSAGAAGAGMVASGGGGGMESPNDESRPSALLPMPLPSPPSSLGGGFGAAPGAVAAAAAAAGPASNNGDDCCSGLVAAIMMMDDATEVLSDHDFDNLPSQEEEFELLLEGDVDDDDGNDEGDAAGFELIEATPKEAAAKAASAPSPASVVRTATGLVSLPPELVLSGMASWTPLDRLRHQMWSRKPLPPRPLPRQQHQHQQHQHQQQHQQQPMTPLEKSKRACSFLLRGHCKKEDCQFAHDLGRVTCKFWSAGECFKGDTCPFLHARRHEASEEEDEAAAVVKKEEKEEAGANK